MPSKTLFQSEKRSKSPVGSGAVLCAKALARAGTDNDRVAALLLTARQLPGLTEAEARSVFARIDADFLLRLLSVEEDAGDSGDALAHASVAVSVLGHLAERDLEGLASRPDFDSLLAGLCCCLARWQPAVADEATSDEARQLVDQLHRALYHISNGLKLEQCREILAKSPLIATLTQAVINLQSDWESSLRLAFVVLDRCAFAGVLDRLADPIDQLLTHLVKEVIVEYDCETSPSNAGYGNSRTGETSGKSQTGESLMKSPTGESLGKSQTGKVQAQECESTEGNNRKTSESRIATILQFASQLLSYATSSCSTIVSGDLAKQLRPVMPGLLGNRSLRAASLSLLANLASASPRGLSDILDSPKPSAGGKKCSQVVAESDLQFLIGSLAALEIDVRLNLADESDRAFELVAANSQHRETLGACFVLLEETLRRLLQQSDPMPRPDLMERLLSRLRGAFDLLLDRLVAAANSVLNKTESAKASSRPLRLFLAACARCLCLWLSEGGELVEQLSGQRPNFIDDTTDGRGQDGFVRLLCWLMTSGGEEAVDAEWLEDADDVSRAALPYLCSLTASDSGVDLLRTTVHGRALVAHLMSACLSRQLTLAASSTSSCALSPLANVLLNLTIGQAHSVSESCEANALCFTGQQLSDMITVLTDYLTDHQANPTPSGSSSDSLSLLVLALASLKLALQLKLNPHPSVATAHSLLLYSLRHIDSCSPSDFSSTDDDQSDCDGGDEDGVAELRMLTLRLTGELLAEHPDCARTSSSEQIAQLLGRIVRRSESVLGRPEFEELAAFAQTAAQFTDAR